MEHREPGIVVGPGEAVGLEVGLDFGVNAEGQLEATVAVRAPGAPTLACSPPSSFRCPRELSRKMAIDILRAQGQEGIAAARALLTED